MAGTGRVPKKGATGKIPAKEGAGGPAAKGAASPLPKEPEREKLPPLAWCVLAAAILLMLAGGLMIMMQFFWAGERTGWLILGFVMGVGGVAAISYFFDKWGKL